MSTKTKLGGYDQKGIKIYKIRDRSFIVSSDLMFISNLLSVDFKL